MSFFGPGGTGRNIAGLLGDVLLQQGGMQPVYAPAVKQRQLMQFEEQQRQRKRLEGREDTLWEYQNKPKEPYIPDAEKQAQWYEQNGNPAAAADVRAKALMIPVQQADLNTGEVRSQYVRPSTMIGGGSQPAATDLPRISTPGEAAKLPPGSWFIAPDGSRRQVPGGAGSGAPRTFPRPY